MSVEHFREGTDDTTPWALGGRRCKEGPSRKRPRVLIVANVEQLARRMDKNAYYRYQALARHENVTLTGPGCSGFERGMPIRALFRMFGRPDFIIHGIDLGATGMPLVEGLDDADAPKAMELEDTWEDPPRQQRFLRDYGFRYAFHTTRPREPDYEANCPGLLPIWTPFAVRTDLFRDYGLEKENDLLLYGAVSEWYPLRMRLRRLLERLAASGARRVKIIPHPGYCDEGYIPQDGHYVGEKLAREINRSWISIATASIFQCLFAKHLEIAAARSLVAGSVVGPARPFFGRGLINLAEQDDGEIVNTLDELLGNKEELSARIDDGYRRIHAGFSVETCAQNLLDLVSRLI